MKGSLQETCINHQPGGKMSEINMTWIFEIHTSSLSAD